ncbi:MAG: coproporphyrinogen dehydrogenase HemZ [Oscillospiraceae bacterium]|nr:coproporphyrinogen dehydrogenase HemZ [Oscillospiraceae bacterium]
MTIILQNDDYKYELEAVVKIFFPAMHFAFEYQKNDVCGDICAARLKKGKEYTYAFAAVRIGGIIKRICAKVENGCKNYVSECEAALCRCLYICLETVTGKKCAWGMLTGVRPAKLVRQLCDKGMTRDEIFEHLQTNFFVTPEKIALAYDIYKLQQQCVDFAQRQKFSLYVSIPFCPTRCSYCSFISHSVESSHKLIDEYCRLLKRELEIIALYAKRCNLAVETVYFGGGTPTSLEAKALSELFETIEKNFDLSQLREYTVEAGRPDTITEEKLRAIKSHGISRISVNPQTTNDEVLKAIGRRHSAEEFFQGYNLARKIGFDCINTDLIAGLPKDSLLSFEKTLDDVIELCPENITVHSLTLKKSAQMYEGGADSFLGDVGKMLDIASQKLTKNGFLPYYIYRQKNTSENLENVGYSTKGKECLYNIYIMDDTRTILGAGCGASSKLVHSEFDMKRFFNFKYPFEYIRDFDRMNEKKQAISQFFEN